VLRACHYGDLDQVLAVERVAFPDRPYTRLDFDSILLRAGEGFMVACQDGSVVGYVIAMEKGGDGLIQSIAVPPEFRMRRIGEALMTAALNHLAKKYGRVYLQVDANNESAISLYRKLSFRETGNRIKGYYPNGNDAIEMVRDRTVPPKSTAIEHSSKEWRKSSQESPSCIGVHCASAEKLARSG